MADAIADYRAAVDGFAAVLAEVGDRWDGPSPCGDWTAGDVADHVIGGAAGLAASLCGEAVAVPDVDRLAQFEAAVGAVVDAASAEGTLDKVVPSPLGAPLPARIVLGIFSTEVLLHTWDLAQAIGEDVTLDADLLQRSWDGARPMSDMIRGPGFFGPALDASPDAPMQAQALAFFGRQA